MLPAMSEPDFQEVHYVASFYLMSFGIWVFTQFAGPIDLYTEAIYRHQNSN